MVTHVFNDGSVILGQFSSKSLCVPSYIPSFGKKDQDKADMGCFEFHTNSPQEWNVEVNLKATCLFLTLPFSLH